MSQATARAGFAASFVVTTSKVLGRLAIADMRTQVGSRFFPSKSKPSCKRLSMPPRPMRGCGPVHNPSSGEGASRSEEHTSELQSHSDLVCRLLLEKKNQNEYSIDY